MKGDLCLFATYLIRLNVNKLCATKRQGPCQDIMYLRCVLQKCRCMGRHVTLARQHRKRPAITCHDINHLIIWVCPAVDLSEPAQTPGLSAAAQRCMVVSRSHIAWRTVLQDWPCYCLGNGTGQGRSWKRSVVRAKTCHQTSRHPEWEFQQSKNFKNDILDGICKKTVIIVLRL